MRSSTECHLGNINLGCPHAGAVGGDGVRPGQPDTTKLLPYLTLSLLRGQARPLDRTQRSDPGPAERILGWPVTGLEDGLRQTIAWYAKRL